MTRFRRESAMAFVSTRSTGRPTRRSTAALNSKYWSAFGSRRDSTTLAVALVTGLAVWGAVALGILVHVLPPELPLAESHFLAWSCAALDKPPGAAFRDWIIGKSRRFDRQVTIGSG